MTDMPTGLIRRGGAYSLRRRIPNDLLAAYGGRKEIVKALGTSDRQEAKRLHAIAWVALDQEFEAHRSKEDQGVVPATGSTPSRVMSPITGEPISPSVIALVHLDTLRSRRDKAAKEGWLVRFNRESKEALVLYQAMLDGDVSSQGEDLRVIEGKRNGLRAFLTGDGSMGLAVRRRTLVPSGEDENQLRARTTTSWDHLVTKWAAERRPEAKTYKAHQAIANEFKAIVGDFPVEQLTKRHGLAFKDGLVARGVTPANLKTKLSRAKTLINYGYDNDLVGVRIMDGLRAPKSKAAGRKPYSDDALQKLFSGPVHTEGWRPVQGRGEAAYWLPLIAAYSGARLEEIAGLRAGDVVELALGPGSSDKSAWFLKFESRPNENRRLKTNGSEREAPIHPELIRLGLVRYAKAIQETNDTHLFPKLTAQASGQRANKWGEWFGKYRRDICGIDDDRIDFHSFRHTFKDACREANLPERLQRQIMGHEAKDVADNYGVGFSRRAVSEAIKAVRLLGMPHIKPPT
ncbi:site-specific integrase [uncultured Brevundimonas sp.]|uniref:site-specific integrase n=1 Tax=uncultured Brevundimonas sp. TaxID=213418 RepID=UPI0025FAD217|nr:site-specific integrase [uncultured Brevundimonas sp.]